MPVRAPRSSERRDFQAIFDQLNTPENEQLRRTVAGIYRQGEEIRATTELVDRTLGTRVVTIPAPPIREEP